MWRVVLGSIFTLASIGVAGWTSYVSVTDAYAETATKSAPSLESYPSMPNQPDLNEIYIQINDIRRESGLEPLVRSADLAKVAQKRADDMSAFGYYAHRSPSGTYFYDMFEDQHYLAGFACENLDMEFTKQADRFVASWLGSTDHRACMLSPLISEAGYAVAELNTTTTSNPGVKSYVVVAIYAQPK